jgi:hypothetical protein
MSSRTYYGGSFAPEMSETDFRYYKSRIDQTDVETVLGDYLRKTLKPIETWWDLPESVGPSGELHKSGRGVLQPLDAEVLEALWEDIPWEPEINAIQAEFEKMPTGELRNIAFHLLWYLKELNLDREPLTRQRVNPSV